MQDETKYRILDEMKRIHNEIFNCAHCISLKQQYTRLSTLLPPEPQEVNGVMYIFDPPKEYQDKVNERLRELGILECTNKKPSNQ